VIEKVLNISTAVEIIIYFPSVRQECRVVDELLSLNWSLSYIGAGRTSNLKAVLIHKIIYTTGKLRCWVWTHFWASTLQTSPRALVNGYPLLSYDVTSYIKSDWLRPSYAQIIEYNLSILMFLFSSQESIFTQTVTSKSHYSSHPSLNLNKNLLEWKLEIKRLNFTFKSIFFINFMKYYKIQ